MKIVKQIEETLVAGVDCDEQPLLWTLYDNPYAVNPTPTADRLVEWKNDKRMVSAGIHTNGKINLLFVNEDTFECRSTLDVNEAINFINRRI